MTPDKRQNPKFFVLQTGDVIQAGDEYYNPCDDRWMPVQPETIGDEWYDDESKPVRRVNPDYDCKFDSIILDAWWFPEGEFWNVSATGYVTTDDEEGYSLSVDTSQFTDDCYEEEIKEGLITLAKSLLGRVSRGVSVQYTGTEFNFIHKDGT